MDETDYKVFVLLMNAAYEKCFSKPMVSALQETESKLFAHRVFDSTGLTVGWRSLKNYSIFMMSANVVRKENPSKATLDTLARYVLNAPYTNDISRKDDESHHPYWFMYRERQLESSISDLFIQEKKPISHRKILIYVTTAVILIVSGVYFYNKFSRPETFTDTFRNNGEKNLNNHGWQIMNKDAAFWQRREQTPGVLTLFTLSGDNWPDSAIKYPAIKNMLIRPLPAECFAAELQLLNFIPQEEWQQAGLLLLQDSTAKSPAIRLSLAYNDLFGGYKKSPEIIIQSIFTNGYTANPEEFIHFPVLTLNNVNQTRDGRFDNLRHVSLRIEKKANHYKFFYSAGSKGNSAYKELAAKEFDFKPKFIALVALKGNATIAKEIPVSISSFTLNPLSCGR